MLTFVDSDRLDVTKLAIACRKVLPEGVMLVRWHDDNPAAA
jgi:hypothetical protein